jgi:cobalt/nickel transport system permease protein
MTLAFSLPPRTDAPLARLDPRWRLAGLLLLAGTAAALGSLPAVAAGLVTACVIAALARLPPRWFLERLGTAAFFLVVFTLPLPFLLDGDGPAWQWGFVRVTWVGTRAALLLSAKALTILTIMLALLASAALDVHLKAARALRVPGLLVHLTLLTYRYIFVLAEELGRLRVALRVRGFRNRATRHGYRTVGNLAGVLLARGLERAERVSQAMRCRGFDGHFHTLTDFRTRAVDVVLFLSCVAVAAGLLVFDLAGR